MCCAFSISHLLSNFTRWKCSKIYIYFLFICIFLLFYFCHIFILFCFPLRVFAIWYLLLLQFWQFRQFLLFLFAFVIFHFIAFQFPLFMMPWISHYHAVVCLLLAWFACLHLAFHFSHYVAVHTWRGNNNNNSNQNDKKS